MSTQKQTNSILIMLKYKESYNKAEDLIRLSNQLSSDKMNGFTFSNLFEMMLSVYGDDMKSKMTAELKAKNEVTNVTKQKTTII